MSSEQCLTFVNQGACVRVYVNGPRALHGVERVLPAGSLIQRSRTPDASFSLVVADDAPHRLYRESDLLQASRHLEPLLKRLESDRPLHGGVARPRVALRPPLLKRLESDLHFTVASHARASLFVHAGVVGWRGRAIVLPGRSMSGKSSLVAALLRAGAAYYSDEYAVIDGKGRIHPYAKPIGLRAPGGGTRQIAPGSIGCKVGTRPLHPALIVSTRYSRGQRFEPEERSPSRALMVLIANTIVIRERPRFALDHLMPVVREARILEGVRGDADAAATWLLRHQDAGEPASVSNTLPAHLE